MAPANVKAPGDFAEISVVCSFTLPVSFVTLLGMKKEGG
jgi:hypothetical protein